MFLARCQGHPHDTSALPTWALGDILWEERAPEHNTSRQHSPMACYDADVVVNRAQEGWGVLPCHATNLVCASEG